MQTQGYMIVLKPEALIKMYDQHLVAQLASSYLREHHEAFASYLYKLRETFVAFDPKRYRGICRESLFAYPSLDQKEIEEFQAKSNWFGVTFGEADARARYRFREIIGKPLDEYDPYPLSGKSYDVLDNLADAKELYFLLDDPKRWEIIHVSLEGSLNSENTLGYDIGYWGEDHFSLIADTIVIPCWHPPPPEDFEEFVRVLHKLNEHLLFTCSNEAEDFLSYYRSKSWAEKEYGGGDEFYIIKVDKVP